MSLEREPRQPSKLLVPALLILALLCWGLYSLFFDASISGSRYSSIREIEKEFFGGIVVNKTNHPIIVTDWRIGHVVQPGQSSRDVAVYDADSLAIQHPTILKGKRYDSGLIRMCDFSRIQVVTNKQGVDAILPTGRFDTCKLFFQDYRHFSSLKAAFPMSH